MKKKVFDPALLEQRWRYENKTLVEISKEVGSSTVTVHKAIRELGLVRCYQDPDWLREQHHVKRLNCKQMAELARCDSQTIYTYMHKYGIEILPEVSRLTRVKWFQNDDYFEKIDTEEKAYWLGFITADGCVTWNTAYHHYILTICLARKDRHHLERFLCAIESNRIPEDFETVLEETGKTYPMSRVQIYSKKMAQDLINLGITPAKSLHEPFPHIPKKFYRAFIRGVYDGDGWFHGFFRSRQRKGAWKWKNGKGESAECRCGIVGGAPLLSRIAEILSTTLGFQVEVKDKKGDVKQIRLHDSEALAFLAWLYDGADLYLDRKHKALATWAARREEGELRKLWIS